MVSIYEELDIEVHEVDSVRALATKFGNLYGVPEIYVRPEARIGEVVEEASFQLPIINLESLQDPLLGINEIAMLRSACEEWGFFQLINHGVDEEIINNMKNNMREFFMLPLEQKKTAANASNVHEGFGKDMVVSNDQKLDWADVCIFHTQPIEKRNMKVWPANPSAFRDTVDKYSHELKKLFEYLLKFLAKGLGIEPEVLLRAFDEHPQSMRMNCYPPCPQAEKVLGLSPHIDSGCLTLLLQVNDVQGLQIRKDDKWFSVEALPGAFVVNIGGVLEGTPSHANISGNMAIIYNEESPITDSVVNLMGLEAEPQEVEIEAILKLLKKGKIEGSEIINFRILSNGIYKSIEHRAVVNSAKERISIATFNNPPLSGTVGPLPEVVKGEKENYMTVTVLEYTRGFFSAKNAGKSYMESMKLIN